MVCTVGTCELHNNTPIAVLVFTITKINTLSSTCSNICPSFVYPFQFFPSLMLCVAGASLLWVPPRCLGSALFKYRKYTSACTKGVLFRTRCTKCTYKRHIVIKQEVNLHDAGDKGTKKYMLSMGLRIYTFKSDLDHAFFYPLSNNLIINIHDLIL